MTFTVSVVNLMGGGNGTGKPFMGGGRNSRVSSDESFWFLGVVSSREAPCSTKQLLVESKRQPFFSPPSFSTASLSLHVSATCELY